MTAIDEKASVMECFDSAIRALDLILIPTRFLYRDKNQAATTDTLATTIPINNSDATRWANRAEADSYIMRKPVEIMINATTSSAIDSAFEWPYGCSTSAGRSETRNPIKIAEAPNMSVKE